MGPDHRYQIETILGRPLADDELRTATGFEALSNGQLETIARLAKSSALAPVMFVQAVIPSASVGDTMRFIAGIEDVIAERRTPPSWPNLALFERVLERPLVAAEIVTSESLERLTTAQLQVATQLARKDPSVVFLYLRRAVPSATTEACNELTKRLTGRD